MKSLDIIDFAFQGKSVFETARKQFDSYTPKDLNVSTEIHQDITSYFNALSKANDALMAFSDGLENYPRDSLEVGDFYGLEEKHEHFKMCFEEDVLFWELKFQKHFIEKLEKEEDSNSKTLFELIHSATEVLQARIHVRYDYLKDKMSHLENELTEGSLIPTSEEPIAKTTQHYGVEMYR